MLQREATKITWDFKQVPYWECFKEVHLFGFVKRKMQALPDIIL